MIGGLVTTCQVLIVSRQDHQHLCAFCVLGDTDADADADANAYSIHIFQAAAEFAGLMHVAVPDVCPIPICGQTPST